MFFLIYRSGEFLPLPDSIKTLFSSGKKREDNPEVHEGRIRSFEHLEGNWATHIGVSCKGQWDIHDDIDLKLTCIRMYALIFVGNFSSVYHVLN